MPIDSATDLLMALLFSKGATANHEKIRGSTKIEKLIFLLEKEGGFDKHDKKYEFDAHNFGPFSDEIYDDIETLKEARLVDVEKEPPKYYAEEADKHISFEQADVIDTEKELVETYKLTDNGLKVGKHIFEKELSEEERNSLEAIKSKFNSMPLHRLLKYVYAKYPDYTTKSIIKKKIIGS